MLTGTLARSLAGLGAGVMALALLAPGTAHADSTRTVLPLRADEWSYRQVSPGSSQGFEDPAYDDSSWSVGQAGFGTATGACGFDVGDEVNTVWDGNGDELVRHHFTVPVGTTSLHLDGSIDNDADVYVNGVLLGHSYDGFCRRGGLSYDVPISLLAADNVVAIRAQNDDTGAAFVDASLTVTVADKPARAKVTGLSPASGPKAGGTLVTITGRGFNDADRVQFGTRAISSADFTVLSDTEISATVPRSTKTGAVQVRVRTASAGTGGGVVGGLSAKSSASRYTYTG